MDLRGRPELTTHLQLEPDGNHFETDADAARPLEAGHPVAAAPPGCYRLCGPCGVDTRFRPRRSHQSELGQRKEAPTLCPTERRWAGLWDVLSGRPDAPISVASIEDIPDALTRGSAWLDVWDNVLEARLTGPEFLDLAARALPKEGDEQNTQLILSYLSRAFWLLLPPQDRIARAPALEAMLREGIARARTASQKSAWFNTFRDVVLTAGGLDWLERVWRREQKIEGLTFAETDEITMALELAVREVPDWQQILAAQRDRTQNPDRKSEFEFVMPALSADPTVREQAFERFRKVENRRREPWVLQSLHYLNHPLREQSRAAIRCSEFGTAARDPAHRRYLLSAALDGSSSRRTSLARGGPGGPGFPGTASGSFRAAAMDSTKFRRRPFPCHPVICGARTHWDSSDLVSL